MNLEPWRAAAKRQPHVPSPQGPDADLRQSGFVTTLKAEAALDGANAPAHGPQRWALGSLHRAVLSEMAWWSNLRLELVRGLALASLRGWSV